MIEPSVRPDSVPSWACRLREFAPHAWRGHEGLQVGHRLLMWLDRKSRPIAILTVGVKGFMVHVDPRYRRRGLASRLLREALGRWPTIDLDAEWYTPAGAAWINAVRRRATRDA